MSWLIALYLYAGLCNGFWVWVVGTDLKWDKNEVMQKAILMAFLWPVSMPFCFGLTALRSMK